VVRRSGVVNPSTVYALMNAAGEFSIQSIPCPFLVAAITFTEYGFKFIVLGIPYEVSDLLKVTLHIGSSVLEHTH
jgi:hypothetical protein